ncbi:hypothetical protein QUB19_13490 [Microcoleus sp. B4-C5]|uniref:hypothetical protein n=1 Tax=unclassified Microcoleus TaxID=2642155 RepID=UPI002FD4CF9C
MQVPNFQTHLRAMKAHYQGTPFSRYSLPITVVDTYPLYRLTAGSTDFDLEYKTVIQKSEQDIREMLNSPQEYIVKETEALVKNPGQAEEFKKQMNKRREETKQKANATIDQIFDQGIELGDQFPEMQSTILTGLDKIGGFISKIFDQISEFITCLIQKIYEWLKDAVKKVKGFFLDAYHSISTFFGLFSTPITLLKTPNSALGVQGERREYDWKKTLEHAHIITVIEMGEPFEIHLTDTEDVKEWQRIYAQEFYLGIDSITKEHLLNLIKNHITSVGLGVLGLSGFLIYAVAKKYEIDIEIANIVKFKMKPGTN